MTSISNLSINPWAVEVPSEVPNNNARFLLASITGSCIEIPPWVLTDWPPPPPVGIRDWDDCRGARDWVGGGGKGENPWGVGAVKADGVDCCIALTICFIWIEWMKSSGQWESPKITPLYEYSITFRSLLPSILFTTLDKFEIVQKHQATVQQSAMRPTSVEVSWLSFASSALVPPTHSELVTKSGSWLSISYPPSLSITDAVDLCSNSPWFSSFLSKLDDGIPFSLSFLLFRSICRSVLNHPKVKRDLGGMPKLQTS